MKTKLLVLTVMMIVTSVLYSQKRDVISKSSVKETIATVIQCTDDGAEKELEKLKKNMYNTFYILNGIETNKHMFNGINKFSIKLNLEISEQIEKIINKNHGSVSFYGLQSFNERLTKKNIDWYIKLMYVRNAEESGFSTISKKSCERMIHVQMNPETFYNNDEYKHHKKNAKEFFYIGNLYK